jgi:hypothetical protein
MKYLYGIVGERSIMISVLERILLSSDGEGIFRQPRKTSASIILVSSGYIMAIT